MAETVLLDLNFDATELEVDSHRHSKDPEVLKITRTILNQEGKSEPPPPPDTPHPDVLSALTKIPVPETKLKFGTHTKVIPLGMVAVLTSTNQARIPEILRTLADEGISCRDAAEFLAMVKRHRSRIHLLVGENRSTAAGYCKRNKLSSKVLHASKFAVFKRLSVWRDSVDDLIKLAERSAQWTEDRRNFLWRRLINTNLFSWYGMNLPETFPLTSYLDE